MSENISEVTDTNFDADVLRSEKPVLLDFWAPWCGPCKAIGPAIDALSGTYQAQFKFAKCNVDDNPETPAKYGVKSIPTLLFFKDGKVVDQITGMVAKGKIEETLKNVLSGKASARPFMVQ